MTLEDRLAWHDREIERRLVNYPMPTPAELELTQELIEQRDRLLMLMARYDKAYWPGMAGYIDEVISLALPDSAKPN